MIKLTNRLTVFLGSLLIATSVQAQVTVDPAFPTADDNVVITFDASGGNGALAASGRLSDGRAFGKPGRPPLQPGARCSLHLPQGRRMRAAPVPV